MTRTYYYIVPNVHLIFAWVDETRIGMFFFRFPFCGLWWWRWRWGDGAGCETERLTRALSDNIVLSQTNNISSAASHFYSLYPTADWDSPGRCKKVNVSIHGEQRKKAISYYISNVICILLLAWLFCRGIHTNELSWEGRNFTIKHRGVSGECCVAGTHVGRYYRFPVQYF